MEIRASQLDGCAPCVDLHRKYARRAGESEERLDALEAWRSQARRFTERERAALAWTEAVARLGPEHVGDRTSRRARAQFSEAELVNLTMAITAIDGCNRLAIAFRAPRRSHVPSAGPAHPGA